MQKKPLELCLYVAGAGAFGVFLRWLENQLAFDDNGLADPSAFHFMLIAFLVTCAVVFWRFLGQIEKKRYYVPEAPQEALHTDVRLHTLLSWAAGGAMAIGALLLFVKSETDPFAGMLRLLSALALLSGAAFPLVLREAQKEAPRLGLMCLMMVLPLLMYAVWLILSFRQNSINSVHLAFALDMLAAIMGMIANFHMAGFAFGAAKPKRALLSVMFCGTVCIMSLADERHMGMEIILLATAGQMLLYTWILLQNLRRKERQVIVQKDDGFEHLQ